METKEMLHGIRRAVAEWLMPPQKQSRYKDSTQIGVTATTELVPSMFFIGGGELVVSMSRGSEIKDLRFPKTRDANSEIARQAEEGWVLKSLSPERTVDLPRMDGRTLVYKSFKPTKAVLTELITVTHTGEGLPDITSSMVVENASDLVLVSAFSGADNCFPSAPSEDSGISGPTFAHDSLGNGISWPVIAGGNDVTLGFAIEQSVLFQVGIGGRCTTCGHGDPLKGYDILPSRVSVKARMNLLGPSL
jgi:hypothetical protein